MKSIEFLEMLFTYLSLIISNWTSFPEEKKKLRVCLYMYVCLSNCVFVTFPNGWVHT